MKIMKIMTAITMMNMMNNDENFRMAEHRENDEATLTNNEQIANWFKKSCNIMKMILSMVKMMKTLKNLCKLTTMMKNTQHDEQSLVLDLALEFADAPFGSSIPSQI